MANKNSPFGLAVARSQSAYHAGETKHYYVPASNASAIYIGDLVVKTGESNATEILGHKAGSLPAVAKASNSGAVTGVVVGVLPDGVIYGRGKIAAGQEAVVLVADSLNTKFNIQCSGELTSTMIGQNANITAGTAGNDFTGVSASTLDVSSVSNTSDLQLKIIGLADYDLNEMGDYAVVEVMINNSTEAHNTAGI